MKSFTAATQKQKESIFSVPRRVQDIIPVDAVYQDGIFRRGNFYSKTYSLADIDYAIASTDDKESIFAGWGDTINALESGCGYKITIINRILGKDELNTFLANAEIADTLSPLRREYNALIESEALTSNRIVQDKYITATIEKLNLDEARQFAVRTETGLQSQLARINSYCTPLDAERRLELFFNFFRSDTALDYNFSLTACMRSGHSFKDTIVPMSMEYKKDHFVMDNKFGRVLFMRDLANFLKDSFISELTGLNAQLMLSIDFVPVPMTEAVKEIETRLLGIEKNITDYMRKREKNRLATISLPYHLAHQQQVTKDLLDDLIARDQRLFFGLVTVVHLADSKEDLDNATEALKATAQKHLCTLSTLMWQQHDGLQTALPFGVRNIAALRTLNTESAAIMQPFHAARIVDKHGLYCGQSPIDNSLLFVDRFRLQNANGWILAVPGAGKSMYAKFELASRRILDDSVEIVVIDPEREYTDLANALGGEIVQISAVSNNHINALDINAEYGDGSDPVRVKSEFLLSLCERLIGSKAIGPKEKSIIDRCANETYEQYIKSGYAGVAPTLRDFHKCLKRQPEQEAKDIALALELFVSGSLDTFARQTNVNTDSKFLVYDIHELGQQLMPIGMLVVLDSILNRVTANRHRGVRTVIYIDEIYLLLLHEYSATFLYTLWKRIRKCGGLITGITQNVEDLLKSDTARTMLSNSEFVVMLNQSSSDCDELARLFNISTTQRKYITNAAAGTGLLRVGKSIVPFSNIIPKESKLYSLISTDFKTHT